MVRTRKQLRLDDDEEIEMVTKYIKTEKDEITKVLR